MLRPVGEARYLPRVAHQPDNLWIAAALVAWFGQSARDLPWRSAVGAPAGCRRDPYRALVSELMLQQTQVGRVVDKFRAFIEAFPDAATLAAAPEERVLACWSGLGYYRRAKLLHAAAKEIVRSHGGVVPSSVGSLQGLPGVGRYTAGAVASMACGQAVALVDGNVARVLFRIRGRDATQGDAADMAWAWEDAEELVAGAAAAGVDVPALNEALMELGATVCTPAAPTCDRCPVRERCTGFAQSRQSSIPRPKPAGVRSVITCDAVAVLDDRGRILLEQRPATGMWASMWQLPTIEEAGRGRRDREKVAAWIGLGDADQLRRLERFTHTTTHRDVRFTLWMYRSAAVPAGGGSPGRVWKSRDELGDLGISNAQRRMIARAFESALSTGGETLPVGPGRSRRAAAR